MTHKETCYRHGCTEQEIKEHGIPCSCDEPETTHTAMCHEYWAGWHSKIGD